MLEPPSGSGQAMKLYHSLPMKHEILARVRCIKVGSVQSQQFDTTNRTPMGPKHHTVEALPRSLAKLKETSMSASILGA